MTQDLEDIVRGAIRQAYEQGFADGQLAVKIRPVVQSMVDRVAMEQADPDGNRQRVALLEADLEKERARVIDLESRLIGKPDTRPALGGLCSVCGCAIALDGSCGCDSDDPIRLETE